MRLLRSRLLRAGVSTVVSGLTLYLALRHVDYDSFWHLLGRIDLWFAGCALVSIAINTWGKAVRWKWLMGVEGRKVRLSLMLRALLIGQMLNNIIPARVGDLSRAHLVGRTGPGRIFTLGTIVSEKIVDTVAFLVLSGVLLLSLPVPGWISQRIYPAAAVGLISLLLLIVMSRQPKMGHVVMQVITRRVPDQVKARVRQYVGQAWRSFAVFQDRRALLHLVWWSIIIWATAIWTNDLVARALHLNLPPISALLVLVVLQVAITIPSVPGTVGVWEYVCVLALSLFSVDRTNAVSYGVLLHIIVFVPTTVVGMICFWGTRFDLWQPNLDTPTEQDA